MKTTSKNCLKKRDNSEHWEIIADNLSKAGWSWGCVATVDSERRAICVVAAERDGQRCIVRADERLTAFIELESASYAFSPAFRCTP